MHAQVHARMHTRCSHQPKAGQRAPSKQRLQLALALKIRAHLFCIFPCATQHGHYRLIYKRGKIFQRFFCGMAQIRRGNFWYCSLDLKEKFGMRPLTTASWWIFIVTTIKLPVNICMFLSHRIKSLLDSLQLFHAQGTWAATLL